MIRKYFSLVILFILTACSSNEQKNDVSPSEPFVSYTIDQPPVTTVINFLKWYKINKHKLGAIEMVNNAYKEHDSTKYYSVNFKETERYLAELKKSNFFSDKYIFDMKGYFENSEVDFKAHPENDGPPKGFDHDFIMQTPNPDEDLKDLDKLQLTYGNGSADKGSVCLEFPSKFTLRYLLIKIKGRWLIDEIESCD